jgi:hypothetical protein
MTRRLGNLCAIVEQCHQAVRVQLCEGERAEAIAIAGVTKPLSTQLRMNARD